MSARTPAMSPSEVSVASVLDRVTGARRGEADELLALHQEVSGETPVVWANRIIGFGEQRYEYESGHSGTMPVLAFASGATKHTLYLVSDFAERWPEALEALGPHRASKACLYITRLSKVDRTVLRELLELSRAETLAS
ncbi:DUF1801 domain-containing protein [Leucobacter sp. L43]|uniref:DUF1801 domain-containing protein n=1 Tax=Leucobacter sp. L43 TaxID=2798040 RepID=UPI0019042D83|nr:DUF1801 domain-containing protein [Leucobacter sp. L43]